MELCFTEGQGGICVMQSSEIFVCVFWRVGIDQKHDVNQRAQRRLIPYIQRIKLNHEGRYPVESPSDGGSTVAGLGPPWALAASPDD